VVVGRYPPGEIAQEIVDGDFDLAFVDAVEAEPLCLGHLQDLQ